MKRNSAIDYLKFIFSLVIFLYHYNLIFDGGYIVVEGFFMISGYLMFRSVNKRREEDELPDATARFVWNKYKALFFPLLFSAISGFLIYDLVVFSPTLTESLSDIPLLLFEVFPLQSRALKEDGLQAFLGISQLCFWLSQYFTRLYERIQPRRRIRFVLRSRYWYTDFCALHMAILE